MHRYIDPLDDYISSESLSEFISELKSYLKSKLQLRYTENGNSYYTCGENHQFPSPAWRPFQHLEKYCDRNGYFWTDIKDLIE